MSREPFIHPTAVIEESAEIGPGSRIWHFVHVSRRAHIGENCVLGQNVYVGPGVRIGNGVKIQNNVSVYEGVEIEDDVFLAPSCVFTNVVRPRAFREQKEAFAKTRVRRGASVGANATIVCGHDIGEYAFIGAGAVITRDVRAHALMLGVPARRERWVCRCGQALPPVSGVEVSCTDCGNAYRIDDKACVATESA